MKSTYKALTKAEEDIMHILWKLEHAFVKDIVDEMPDPKPHYNTVSTIIKILEDKGFVSHQEFGKANRYYALIYKDDYSKKTMIQFVSKYFEGSFSNMFSFFAKDNNISASELESILEELKKNDSVK